MKLDQELFSCHDKCLLARLPAACIGYNKSTHNKISFITFIINSLLFCFEILYVCQYTHDLDAWIEAKVSGLVAESGSLDAEKDRYLMYRWPHNAV
jgi:hypothetical protein